MTHAAAGAINLAALRELDRTGLLDGIDRALVWELPLRTRFRGITRRDGILLHGPAGWGEVAPFWDYDADACAPWLASALEQAHTGYADLPRHRETVDVNVTIPEVGEDRARALVTASGATTAKVKVAGADDALAADIQRLRAVRDAIGPDGRVRIDVNGAWDLDTARRVLPLMDEAADGLEYAEQPCARVEDLAALRESVRVPLAADESVRLSDDPLAVRRLGAADIVVLKAAPLGGVRRALALAERLALPAVVSSALDTSVGIGAGSALAAALPDLTHACGLGTVTLLTTDVAVPSAVPRAGRLPVRTPHVSETLLAAARADAELTERWQTRLGHMIGALRTRREREAGGGALVGEIPL
ncbi:MULTISPECIES: o-succinylbenzoate synthase [Actinomyces]|uniref:o-succinylbenzoate synthase n=1 Tax=Actinomyces respiraculi TaxID=2744574 RepID=A0A7T0PVY9_9ACTO|nr:MULTISPECIES: o-succinylbenzoate synthase [Actinomyces]QPL05766.1 o-succinylbenzoate synthase [Actinomyces respiraculi]